MTSLQNDPVRTDVAVIISVYMNDRVEWFIRAVESVVNQTYCNGAIHIYLGVDGSIPDEIQKYIENCNYFYKILINKKNIGLAETLNRLIDMLEDEAYIIRIDSDDECYLDRIEKQIAFMTENLDVDVLGAWCEEIDENNNFDFLKKRPFDNDSLRKNIVKRNPFIHSTVTLRKRVFTEGYRYPTDAYLTEDYALWINLAHAGFIFANIQAPLIKFHVTSKTLVKRRGLRKVLAETKYRLKAIKYNVAPSPINYLYIIIHLFIRLAPISVVKTIYKFRT